MGSSLSTCGFNSSRSGVLELEPRNTRNGLSAKKDPRRWITSVSAPGNVCQRTSCAAGYVSVLAGGPCRLLFGKSSDSAPRPFDERQIVGETTLEQYADAEM